MFHKTFLVNNLKTVTVCFNQRQQKEEFTVFALMRRET